MTPYALTEQRGAFLNTVFGRAYTLIIFELSEAELEAIVGRYQSGKWAGELRGKITWMKCVEGGWYKLGGEGRVLKPGTYDHRIVDPWARDPQGGDRVIWPLK